MFRDSVKVLVVLMVASTGAHICLISPPQRGSGTGFRIDEIGSVDCLRIIGPCGGIPAGEPTATYKASENISVRFQKNVDHFSAETAGHFTVRLLTEDGFQEIGQLPDTDEGSLVEYSGSFPIPEGIIGDTVLQVIYMANNPRVPYPFYQCADIVIE